MRFVFLLFILLCFQNSLRAESSLSSQLKTVEDVIVVTEQNLDHVRALHEMIIRYGKEQESYLKDTTDKDKAFHMVRFAKRIQDYAEENHLTHLFTPEFKSELSLFSKIAKKPSIPSP